jgi:signal peptidase II
MLKKSALLIALVLIIDQLLKVWIKTGLMLGQEIQILDWFILHFTENKGMAFGMEFGGTIGKYMLSIFRIVAIVAIGIYWYKLAKTDIKKGIIYSISLILAGAIGNMIDSAFYGMIFSDSYGQIATVFQGGYSSFLQGNVVDMFYFPLVNGHFPDWFPVVGGNHFIFFRPVFNIADASIFTGTTIILLFYRKTFTTDVNI